MTHVYINPADNVDSFCSQIQSSVTKALDTLRHFRLARSAMASAAADGCLKLPLQPSRTDVVLNSTGGRPALSDRVVYRAACHAANAEINTSRSAFYTSRLNEAAGDPRATWRITKELLHSDN